MTILPGDLFSCAVLVRWTDEKKNGYVSISGVSEKRVREGEKL